MVSAGVVPFVAAFVAVAFEVDVVCGSEECVGSPGELVALREGAITAGRDVSEGVVVVDTTGGVVVSAVLLPAGITAREVGGGRLTGPSPSDDVDDGDVEVKAGGVLDGMLDELSLLSAPRLVDETNDAVFVKDDRLGSPSVSVGMLWTIGALDEVLAVLFESASRRAIMGRRGSRRPKGPSGLASTAAVAARKTRGSDVSML